LLQLVMNSGDNDAQVIDLVDAPELVLFNFCDITLRRQDMKNPEAQRIVRQTIDALKVKATQEPVPVGPACINRYSLKEYITEVEKILERFTNKNDEESMKDDC